MTHAMDPRPPVDVTRLAAGGQGLSVSRALVTARHARPPGQMTYWIGRQCLPPVIIDIRCASTTSLSSAQRCANLGPARTARWIGACDAAE